MSAGVRQRPTPRRRPSAVRVALVGANGHGRVHRRNIARLADLGELRLVAVADVRPVEPDPPLPEGVRVFTDHRELLAVTHPDVVVVCTPPHTHLAIALDAVRAGADVLLEKPPVLSLAEHGRLTDALVATGRVGQVGFQALGSAALGRLESTVRSGALGRLTGIATMGCWQRDDAYYARAPWAGRRTVDGGPVLDGALVNPFAHALMQCLAVAEAAGAGPPVRIAVERYRTRPIEVDDTTVARVTLHSGLVVLAAVTLAGEEFVAGDVVVTGSAGRAVLEYPTDRLTVPGEPAREVPGRVDLLENLVAHRRDPAGVPLIAPLARTAPFTAVAQALAGAAAPALLDGDRVVSIGKPPARVRSIRGVNAVLRQAVAGLALPSELGVPWAVRPWTENLLQTTEEPVR